VERACKGVRAQIAFGGLFDVKQLFARVSISGRAVRRINGDTYDEIHVRWLIQMIKPESLLSVKAVPHRGGRVALSCGN
jgi:hypothetical protein